MIRSFANSDTQKVWNGERSRKLPPDIVQRAYARLRMLDAAESLDDLRNPPSNRLHALKDDDAHDVEIADYH